MHTAQHGQRELLGAECFYQRLAVLHKGLLAHTSRFYGPLFLVTQSRLSQQGALRALLHSVSRHSRVNLGRLSAHRAHQEGIIDVDPLLIDHEEHLLYRWERFRGTLKNICDNAGSLADFAKGYQKFGIHRGQGCTVYTEWAPGAVSAQLLGDFNGWNGTWMENDEYGIWSCKIPDNMDGSPGIPHNSKVKIRLKHSDGWSVDVLPAWTRYAVANESEKGVTYDALHWDPPVEARYGMCHPHPQSPTSLRIYEAHIGIGSQEKRVASYSEFAENVIPRIVKQGYNTIQLMAIQEHAYYGSFGYHVTNPFAASSRFGTPEDLKRLIDAAHEQGLIVLLDVVHSHVSKNAVDGLSGFDMGQREQLSYFCSGDKGFHKVWDSRLLNYGNWEVLRFDGFRFDGVTSMLYHHHGISFNFTGNYGEYFSTATNVDAVVYLMLANKLIHELRPQAITISEDVSGMPGLCRPVSEGGVGFDFRLHMGLPDLWFDLVGNGKDGAWPMGEIAASLRNRRETEKCVAYVECHDQCLVGGQTLAFRLMGTEMWTGMSSLGIALPAIQRGIALHKIIRLITFTLGGDAWLNFMGNEFGHPDWLDFPREGNGWSFEKCCRQWNLVDDPNLQYQFLNAWDSSMMHLEQMYNFLQSKNCDITHVCEEAQVIVGERGPLVLIFNFSTGGAENLEVAVSRAGTYSLVLNSDAVEFGGMGQRTPSWDVITSCTNSFGAGKMGCTMCISCPDRTAIVYKLV